MVKNSLGDVNTGAKEMSRWKRTAILMAGFGFGGLLWGLEAYRGTVGTDSSFVSPFSFLLGAVAMGFFGGLAMSTEFHRHTTEGGFLNVVVSDTKNCVYSKKFWAILGFGTLGWVVGFVVPAVWVDWWFTGSALVISSSLSLLGDSEDFILGIPPYLGLEPSVRITTLFLEFLITGGLVGLVYSQLIKTQIIKTVLWCAGGFALAAFVGPIFGNLVGDLFDSLFVSYATTFLIIGAVFGVFLSANLDKKEKEGSMVQ